VLYKLNTFDLSIEAEYNIGTHYGISYDSDHEVIWIVSQVEHRIKCFNPATGSFEDTYTPVVSPISPTEYGLSYDGDYFVISSLNDGGHLYRIIAEEYVSTPPVTTPPTTNSTAPEGLIPGLDPLFEDLVFLGAGIVLTSIIAIIIAIARRKKN
jgi:hypothetical protein